MSVRSLDEKMITLSTYQFVPKYTEEEMLQGEAKCDRERARRGATAAIGLTRTPTSGTNRLQQRSIMPNYANHNRVFFFHGWNKLGLLSEEWTNLLWVMRHPDFSALLRVRDEVVCLLVRNMACFLRQSESH